MWSASWLDYLLTDGYIRGFFVGQLVSWLIVLFLIRYLFLASPGPTRLTVRGPQRKKPLATTTATLSSSEKPSTSEAIDAILHRLGIDSRKEVDESVGWLNLLLARLLFAQLQEDEGILAKITAQLEETVASVAPFIKDFAVRKFELTAGQVPRIQGFRLKRFLGAPLTLGGAPSTYCLEGKLRWEEAGHFEIEAAPAFTWPAASSTQPLIMLPCSLGVRLVSVEAMVRIALPDDQCRQLELSLVPDQYTLELEVESSIGHVAKLRNAEQVARLLSAVLRKAIEDGLVWPNRIPIEIPKLSDLIV